MIVVQSETSVASSCSYTALDERRLAACWDSRQEQGDEHADNCDHNEQFNQSESTPAKCNHLDWARNDKIFDQLRRRSNR